MPFAEIFTFCTDPEIPEPVDTVDQGQIPVPSYKWYIAETCRIQGYIIPEPVHTVDQGQIPVPSYKWYIAETCRLQGYINQAKMKK